MPLYKSRVLILTVCLISLLLTGCDNGEIRSDQSIIDKQESTSTLEDAIQTKVNNPIDNAIKMHQVKEKLEERVGEFQERYNKEAEKVMQENN